VRIHQVTDLHVPDDDGDPRFVHVRENVLRQFSFVESHAPDLLIVSGDLTMRDASDVGCRWVHSNLPDVPTIVIPGNHDDPHLIQSIFGAEHWPAVRDYADCSLVFLDTSSDQLPANQIEFLGDLSPKKPAILFIHHPTKEVSGGFMDVNHPLANRSEVDEVIADSHIDHVFCGHYHTEFEIHDDYHLYVTPSPAFEVDRDSVKPKIGPPRVPLREIVVEGSDVTNRMVYLD
jgi:3',5'-cyclic AMP phosphodiesterase CpdA